MLYINIQGKRLSDSREEEFLLYMVMAAILTLNIWTKLSLPHPREVPHEIPHEICLQSA